MLHWAEGNPLALVELPKTAEHLPASPVEQASLLPLTRRSENLYRHRISELAPSTQEALLLAALDGLSSVAGPRRPALERRLGDVDEAIGRGLLLVNPVTGQLGFRHPLVRSAVVQLATPNRRRTAHAELAELYPDDQERRAHHLAEATVDPDEKVAALLERAAAAATRRGASSVAVNWLERSAQLSERPDERSRRLAEAAFVAGQSAQLERAQELSEIADAGTAGTGTIIAESYAALYRDGEVRTTHRKVVATLERLDPVRDKPAVERLINLLLVISSSRPTPRPGRSPSRVWTASATLPIRKVPPAVFIATRGATSSAGAQAVWNVCGRISSAPPPIGRGMPCDCWSPPTTWMHSTSSAHCWPASLPGSRMRAPPETP
ncbi:hypothetical protein [Streptomyces sp. NPDC048521]|uniref:hypothetical protein n=1 Tax=Streptomyces sp. NPDC048521 TaxID=3365566 RepID=UPI0037209A86